MLNQLNKIQLFLREFEKLFKRVNFQTSQIKEKALENGLDFYEFNMSTLKLDVGIYIPFIVSKELSVLTNPAVADIERFVELTNIKNILERNFRVLIFGGKLPELSKERLRWLGDMRILLIDKTDMDSITDAVDFSQKTKIIARILAKYLGKSRLSPYHPGSPATGGRFFDRTTYLRKLLSSKDNFVIAGNRRIGKTSLVYEAFSRLREEKVNTIIIDGNNCHNTSDVIAELLSGVDQFRLAERFTKGKFSIKKFPRYFLGALKNRPTAVFIDEMDNILEFDSKDHELLNLLRETFNGQEKCRLFMAGFRKVMEAVSIRDHPLSNFGDRFSLKVFTLEETREMVITPLSLLGIDLSDTNLPEVIHRETCGQPELIQIHCNEIIKSAGNDGKISKESAEDILSEIHESDIYQQKVLDSFLANTNAIEELLCYLLIENSKNLQSPIANYEFSWSDVDKALKRVGINFNTNQIRRITQNLLIIGVFIETPRTFVYRFAVPQLANYCLSIDIKFLIEKASELKPEDIQLLISTEYKDLY
jgi:hypothetical protein